MARKKKKELMNIRSLWVLILVMLASSAAVIAVFVFCVLQYTKTPMQTSESESKSSEASEEEEELPDDPLHAKYGPLADIRIQLTFDKKTETLTIDEVGDWVTVKKKKKKYTYEVDETKVREYTDELDRRYTTFQPYVSFTTAYGEEKELLNHSTGWIFDAQYAAEMITDYLENDISVSLCLTDRSEKSNRWWSRVSSDYNAEKKKGSYYAEISIDLQYMWLYKDGEIVLESAVVTGNPNTGNDTPTGAFIVYNKEEGAILYGPGYYLRVDYWIGFADEVGFHDASWQEAFGGDCYLTDGSHGCVNLPTNVAKEVYELSYEYMPVYVY